MEKNIQYLYPGGLIEQAPATQIIIQDEQTGQNKSLDLEDRVIVTFGKKKVTINGAMAQAIHETYSNSGTFRDWCERCR